MTRELTLRTDIIRGLENNLKFMLGIPRGLREFFFYTQNTEVNVKMNKMKERRVFGKLDCDY